MKHLEFSHAIARRAGFGLLKSHARIGDARRSGAFETGRLRLFPD
ncbi:hypothetical protein [Stappia sediminis]|nr:hypothetical protein [Stappia sediminis]